jgi:hypothetical protein
MNLPASAVLISDVSLSLLRRWAKALAQLGHPNIVMIPSVEASDGVHFLMMQHLRKNWSRQSLFDTPLAAL